MSTIRSRVMEMLLRVLIVLELSWISNSFNVYEPARIPGWNYFGYSWSEPRPSVVFRKPMAAMVDLTNDLGVAILQDYAYSRSNFAFSPYGVASVLVVLYEGARGESARQIHRAVKFPWDRDITRIGFRDIHRHLRSYFSHEGYLSGITLSKEGSSLKPEYKRVLRFYGYDVDVDSSDKASESPPLNAPENPPSTTATTTTSTASSTVDNTNTEGNDVTTIREVDTEETNIATTTVKPMLDDDVNATSLNAGDVDVTIPTESNPTTLNAGEIDITPISTESNPTTLNAGEMDVTTTSTESNPTTEEGDNITEGVQQNDVTEILPEDKQTSESTVSTTENVVQTTTNIQESTITNINEQPTTESVTQSQTSLAETVPTDIPTTQETSTAHVTESTTDATTPTEQSTTEITYEATTNGDVETTTHDMVEDVTQTGVTEELAAIKESENITAEDEEHRFINDNPLDNGMLIPQSSTNVETRSRLIDLPEERIENLKQVESTSGWQELSVALIAEGDRIKWEPKTLDQFLQNLMNTAKQNGRTLNRYRRSRLTDIYTKTNQEKNIRVSHVQNRTTPVDCATSARLKSRQSKKEKRTISDYSRIPPVTDLSLQLQNGMFDSHVAKDSDLYRVLPRFMFLVDGAIDTPVPMMSYTNIFPYAYIPRLHSKALEFPLDDERYKLLIILPVERRGLRQLIYDLSSYPLRDVIDALRPARVKTMVPTFMVEGFVILTPTLQKLGIWDVFDPRRADLSGMSTDPELYVRNIEQSVTVVIRNYVEILDIQTRTMAARDIDEEFTASHPFLYFVMDTATNVALMAGQMLDPLNSRIY